MTTRPKTPLIFMIIWIGGRISSNEKMPKKETSNWKVPKKFSMRSIEWDTKNIFGMLER